MIVQEALELVHFAVEGRKRVKDQLYILDEVFRDSPVNFQYKVKSSSGRTVEVETLENLNYGTNRKKYPAQPQTPAEAPEEQEQPGAHSTVH